MVISSIGLALLGVIVLAVRYSIVFPRQPFAGPLPELTRAERAMAGRLAGHLRAVASRPHNIDHYPALEAAARYIEATLRQFGHVPTAQRYEVEGREVRNIEVVIAPPDASPETPTLVVGAHYDSPDDSPGANDNGTGVAALLELARALRDLAPRSHRLRLVFFVNEEHPYGKSPAMGSWRHARSLKESGERVAGMIALETLGYFSDEPGSQAFPFPFGAVYSNVGNFVAFVGLPGSRRLVHKVIGAFRRETAFPSIGGVAPGFLEGIDLSDHWAYHQFGFPALMITDTAPFRNPYYHQLDDLPETVDTESLARITSGLERMVRALVA
ncbi:MAG: M28 family peptidase [Pseudomonadota bacterium]